MLAAQICVDIFNNSEASVEIPLAICQGDQADVNF